jgi:hypothetical protein
MAADHGHPQPPQAPQPPARRRERLTATAGETRHGSDHCSAGNRRRAPRRACRSYATASRDRSTLLALPAECPFRVVPALSGLTAPGAPAECRFRVVGAVVRCASVLAGGLGGSERWAAAGRRISARRRSAGGGEKSAALICLRCPATPCRGGRRRGLQRPCAPAEQCRQGQHERRREPGGAAGSAATRVVVSPHRPPSDRFESWGTGCHVAAITGHRVANAGASRSLRPHYDVERKDIGPRAEFGLRAHGRPREHGNCRCAILTGSALRPGAARVRFDLQAHRAVWEGARPTQGETSWGRAG